MDYTQETVVACSKFFPIQAQVEALMSEAASPEGALVGQLRAWRERRGLTAQQLADRLAAQGGDKLSRQAISKIENGDRRVTLDEVASLAWALRVPPILLFLPLGLHPYVQINGRDMDTWTSVKWWMGEVYTQDSDGAGENVLAYFRDHDEIRRSIEKDRSYVGVERSTDDVDRAEYRVQRLRDLRTNMRRAGVIPPELPPELADIEDTEAGDNTAWCAGGRAPTVTATSDSNPQDVVDQVSDVLAYLQRVSSTISQAAGVLRWMGNDEFEHRFDAAAGAIGELYAALSQAEAPYAQRAREAACAAIPEDV